MSAASNLTASGTVIRTGTSVEERLEAIQNELGRLEAQAVNITREFMGHIDKVRADHVAALEKVVRNNEQVEKDTSELVAKARVSGICVAAPGVVLSLLGLVLEHAKPDWVFIF